MITKLTKEQEQAIPEYIDKWVSIAQRPMNKEKAIEYTKKMYKSMEQKEPIVIIGSSPFNTALLCALFWVLFKGDKDAIGSQLRSQLDSQLGSQLSLQLRLQLRSQLGSQLDSQLRLQLRLQLRSQLGSQLDSQLRLQLRSQLDSQLGSQLRSQLDSQLGSQLSLQLRSQLGSQLDSQLRSQLDSQLGSQLSLQLRSQLKNINNDWYLGLWWLAWCGCYDYGKFIGVQFNTDKYDLFLNFNSEVHFIIPYRGIAFISEKPQEIHWKDKQLHNDKDKAIKYPDGYGLYSLNNVAVPEYLVKTNESALKIDFFLKEKNADVKAEFIRKYGIERMIKHGTLVDSYKNHNNKWWAESEYEVWDMKPIFNGITKHGQCCFLKMKNQTTGIFHLEGINPYHGRVDTIKKALAVREKVTEEQTKETIWVA